ncbi:tyrosine-protein phosphatase [Bacillus suaedae]|uniref:Tyrosine-protein phosphatase n=1 Tax=Halalkalibacter suaedae TaxID=2822140 RepID=A0A940WVH3_9BACI|nr:CpsB/CapC family capsule biosynthesis tyrosine phosphatase [Bacillus suaedae]MBP3953165.1 tyrosine protein phosphatase [Bacillus suaedae]
MIDMHCHILPGIDDGPRTLAESLELAKLAERDGITTIVATPHHQHPSFMNDGPSVLRAVDELNTQLKENNINIEVVPSQEIRIHGDMIEQLKVGDLLTYGQDNQYLLIEFPSNHIPHYTTKLFYDLQVNNYIPIIAHPERNKVLIEKPDILYDFVKNGALAQVTSSSITGHFGKKIKKFSEQLVEANLAHFIASDAHNQGERPFRLQEAYGLIEKEFGTNVVFGFKENAELLVEGKHVFGGQPERVIARKKVFGIF